MWLTRGGMSPARGRGADTGSSPIAEMRARAQLQIDQLDRAGGGVAQRDDRVADAGGDDDGGRAELVAAVDELGLEAGGAEVGEAEGGVDLAAVGVAGEHEVDLVGDDRGEPGVE